MNRLDSWWNHAVETRRYDFTPNYVAAVFGFLFVSMSMLLIGPTTSGPIARLDGSTQWVLAGFMFLGSGICSAGIFSGSRFFFPKMIRRTSYGLGIIGTPMVVATVLYYALTLMIYTPNWTSALAGGLAPCLAIGQAISAFFLWLEIRRIDRNVAQIKKVEQ